MADFQTQVYVQPAPAVAGDFASANPRWTYVAGPGGAVAGPNGVTVGLFAWAAPAPPDADGAPTIMNNYGSAAPAGIIAREQQALITGYLQAASNLIPAGFPVTPFTGADIWVKNSGSTQAVPGQKAYANYASGAVSFAATGSPSTGATSTSASIVAATASVTASLSNNIMTVTVVGSGTLVPGGVLTGFATGTQIVSQLVPLLSGETTGGVGRYYVSIPEQTVASGTVTETYGLLTTAATITGTFTVGGILTGSGGATVTSGSVITGLGTGTGGTGTYYVNPTQSSGSGTIAETGNIETKWIAMSSGLVNELVKISTQPLG